MSKFLKVIVNLFLVFAILVAGAILVPPVLGVSTTMIDSASMDTNLPVGSITYSQNEAVTNIVAGDKLLIESDNCVYVYVVESADAVTGKFMVVNELGGQTEPEELTLRNEVLKVVLTVPLIGYIMVAMHSVEGLIIIGLVVLFVIILFILSELWKKSDEDEDEDAEDEVFETAVDDHKEEGAVDTQLENEAETLAEETADAEIPEEPVGELTSDELAQAIAESMDDTVKSEAVQENQDAKVQVDEAEIIEKEIEQEEPVAEEAKKEDTFVKVPRPELEEILSKAEQAGDTPEVIPYDAFGVTVVDFSKCI